MSNPVLPQSPSQLGPQAPQRLGRYTVFAEIAAGGMATVHLGRLLGSAGFARTVAIKRLHPHLARDPSFVRMFLDEARVAARVRHPNVVHILDVAAEESELLLVMEYVLGESLGRIIRAASLEGLRLPPPVVSAIAINLLDGLDAAHEATSERGHPLGLVHRDISPQNVLVGKDGVARILDFGIAKAEGRMNETQDGSVKGKFAYMSPEQIDGNPVDRRTDIFAASIVIWEALAGERLFMGDRPAALVQAVLTAPIRRPSEVVPQLPPEFDEVVLRGLSRDPNQRFATARDMAIAIERACRPASAREVGEWVELLAGPALRERQSLVESIEAESSMSDEGARELQARLASGHGMVASAVDRHLSDSSVSRVDAVRRPTLGVGGEPFDPSASASQSMPRDGLARLTSQTQAAFVALRESTVSWTRALAVLGIVTAIGVFGLLVVLGVRAFAHRARAVPPTPTGPATSVSVDVPVEPTGDVAALTSASPSASTPPESASAAPTTPPQAPKETPSVGKDPSATTAPPASSKDTRKHVDPSRPSKPPATAAAPNDCDNPFTLDPVTGIKRPKVHCFNKK